MVEPGVIGAGYGGGGRPCPWWYCRRCPWWCWLRVVVAPLPMVVLAMPLVTDSAARIRGSGEGGIGGAIEPPVQACVA
jgi:hypothetical protein